MLTCRSLAGLSRQTVWRVDIVGSSKPYGCGVTSVFGPGGGERTIDAH
jgi:hypothetical protein